MPTSMVHTLRKLYDGLVNNQHDSTSCVLSIQPQHNAIQSIHVVHAVQALSTSEYHNIQLHGVTNLHVYAYASLSNTTKPTSTTNLRPCRTPTQSSNATSRLWPPTTQSCDATLPRCQEPLQTSRSTSRRRPSPSQPSNNTRQGCHKLAQTCTTAFRCWSRNGERWKRGVLRPPSFSACVARPWTRKGGHCGTSSTT